MKKFTKKQLRELKANTDNKLKKTVINHLLQYGDVDDCNSHFEDILNYGCSGGCVSELIYYSDTVKWFNKFRSEINELVKEMKEDLGMSITELRNFDKDDPMCIETHNQNILAWFSFEQTCYNIMNELELEW